MNFLEPLGVEAEDATNTLHIEWSDGHSTQHNIEHLRWLCPCAECRGEWGVPGTLDRIRHLTSTQTVLTDVLPVGRYALMPVWGDGHRTGIYTFEYLRKNCECPACQATRAGQPAQPAESVP